MRRSGFGPSRLLGSHGLSMEDTDGPDGRADGIPAHELLGLSPDERDPVRIVEAAAIRLRALIQANGHDDVQRSLARLIRQARDRMLARLNHDGHPN